MKGALSLLTIDYLQCFGKNVRMNGKEKMIDLVKGYNLPLQEKHTELFKKDLAMFEKDFEVF